LLGAGQHRDVVVIFGPVDSAEYVHPFLLSSLLVLV
jgi:hypothetical protein